MRTPALTGQPLNCFPAGSKVTIAHLDACRGAKSRLYSMGLIPGTEVEITSGGCGPCRMKVRNSELVLGHGMASKILAFKAE
ncbi:MAG: ferrous iron transport protein A [Desulfohalobiaceae bacterium]|nr:ferrous iron transport protein A [Desulfohalobiaceae bacterium]